MNHHMGLKTAESRVFTNTNKKNNLMSHQHIKIVKYQKTQQPEDADVSFIML